MIDIPKKFKEVKELNNTFSPDFYRIINYQKFHYDGSDNLFYNPLFSLDFDIDYNALPQIQVVGEKRWDTLFNDLYGQTYGWQILAYLNNVIDPFTEKPASGAFIYYVDPTTMAQIINSLKGG
jgi:hypothetical protein